MAWFAALTGESAGSQSGVTYPAQPALNEPTAPEYDGPGGTAETNCDANHVANLDDPTYGLEHDLSLPANEVPAFNWITPNNCSDAHDATCAGQQPVGSVQRQRNAGLHPGGGLPSYDPEATTPENYTGGLYAADLFLRYYIPLIERSAAFADGGLIDVTFDEANPPFTVGNSFNNEPATGDATTYPAPADQPTYGTSGTTAPGANSLYGAYGILTDAAGENINGENVSTEPTGPERPGGDQQQRRAAAAGTRRVGLHRPCDRAGRRGSDQWFFKRDERIAWRDDRNGRRGAGIELGLRLQDQRRRHRPTGFVPRSHLSVHFLSLR